MLYTTAINTSVRRRGLLQQKVGRSMVSVFGNTNALCNNGWTDRDAVCQTDSRGTKESRMPVQTANWNGQFFFWGGGQMWGEQMPARCKVYRPRDSAKVGNQQRCSLLPNHFIHFLLKCLVVLRMS